jgi:hypothetical protein
VVLRFEGARLLLGYRVAMPSSALRRARRRRWWLGLGCLLALAGCASGRGRTPAGDGPEASAAGASGSGPPAESTAAPSPDRTGAATEAAAPPGPPSASPPPTGEGAPETARIVCREGKPEGEAFLDATRRRLWETLCSANLWFDGLFGEHRNPENARDVSGRIEVSAIGNRVEGYKVRSRIDVNYELPNLEHRWNAFIGRGSDANDFIQDRRKGLGLRSQFLDVETDERWLAGLGYSLPGSYQRSIDFRVGGSGGREPEVFAQGRFRRNWIVDERNLVHLREAAFWTNRQGFGVTAGVDYDRYLRRSLLARWGTIGTYSEDTHGVNWRSALVLYNDLTGRRAIAYEGFVRGETDAPVPLSEYGARIVYRQALTRQWLFGEIVFGYSWPRLRLEDRRGGATTFGVGLDLGFGRDD